MKKVKRPRPQHVWLVWSRETKAVRAGGPTRKSAFEALGVADQRDWGWVHFVALGWQCDRFVKVEPKRGKRA